MLNIFKQQPLLMNLEKLKIEILKNANINK